MKALESADIVTTVGGGSKLEKAMRPVAVSLGEIQLAVLDLASAVDARVLGNVADSTGRRKALIDHPRCPGSQGVQGRYGSGPHSSSSLRWSSCLSVCTSQGRG